MDYTIFIQLGKILLLSWVITRFKPIQIIIELLPDNLLFNLVKLLLTCAMCVSFWLTLSLTQDVYLASLNAFILFWYDKIFAYYENRVRLR